MDNMVEMTFEVDAELYEKVNLCTLFHALSIAIYRHLCYNQDIEQML